MRPTERVAEAYRRDELAARPEIWIARRDRADALGAAKLVEGRIAAGEDLPLAGLTVAVKDTIDVAGMATTAGCPSFSYRPTEDAPAVARLTQAGAVIIGKTNLDQFATGLTGTSSPYGAVRDARRPDHISGGSSSGSAVAVALGICDVSLGSDLAGSGRVPAAFQGIVGLKPTRGLIPTAGMVPTWRSYDCVSIFAASLSLAEQALTVMAGMAPGDHTGRTWPADAPIGLERPPRIGVPAPSALDPLTRQARSAFERVARGLAEQGAELVPVDLAPFLAAGELLSTGALIGARHSAAAASIDAGARDVDPTVAKVTSAAGRIGASALAADLARLVELQAAALAQLDGVDALVLPTTTQRPTIAAVVADPITVNSRLGTYANFSGLLDLCGVAVPAGQADGGEFGVTVFARAFEDAVAAKVAALVIGEELSASIRPPGIDLLVVGAHRAGQPLNHQLTSRGAHFVEARMTAPEYRLYALATQPPKPGLVRSASNGGSIEGEIWRLSRPALADFLAELPQPMALGSVRLDDGTTTVGFICEPIAISEESVEITAFGSWLKYLA